MNEKYPEYKGLNLPEISTQIQESWERQSIFEQSMDSREGAAPFVFFEGPPSANGMPGIHHVMARSIKDIFCRFKTLKGFHVKRKAGWDTHGLPVELGVEKELGITKEDIGKKISVDEYNTACKKAVMKYTDVWNDLTKKMGYWVDMEAPYVTSIQIYGIGMVAHFRIAQKEFTIQRVYDTTLFSQSWNGLVFTRNQSAGML
jgi:isoleucyl-tRNA synthetase